MSFLFTPQFDPTREPFSKCHHLSLSLSFFSHILEIFAFFMLTGIFSTLLLPETKGFTLEELSNEDQTGFIRGTSRSRSLLFLPFVNEQGTYFLFLFWLP